MDSGNSENNAAESSIQFKHFDVVTAEPTDHYYRNSNNSEKNPNSPLYATIVKEWKILRKNLPDSIYVTVYETRIDLVRAVIVGPAQTPYENGLFFFDILLPSDYPNKPPYVYYHSHGYRINPNLYNNGKVCLSLINTWEGQTSERWTQESTLLQVLVSIQGLVLNERPYFNEPGFLNAKNSKDSIWIKRSIRYNEVAFVLSCKTMLHVMRSPPENFEGFVAYHFHERAASILATIKDYHDGRVMIDRFQMYLLPFEVSKKFQADLTRLHSDFKKVFPDVICEPMKINKKELFGRLISSFGKCLVGME